VRQASDATLSEDVIEDELRGNFAAASVASTAEWPT
jgi:hypothetical protein